MPDLKLPKLPDRTPVKINFKASPELGQALNDYAAVYRARYGQQETVEELIPFMLASFIEADTGFKKARRELGSDGNGPADGENAKRRRRGRATAVPAPANDNRSESC